MRGALAGPVVARDQDGVVDMVAVDREHLGQSGTGRVEAGFELLDQGRLAGTGRPRERDDPAPAVTPAEQ